MNIWLNGEQRELVAGSSVVELLVLSGLSSGQRGVAVAVGSEVVPRSEWSKRELQEGDRVEILVASQGG